MEMYVVITVYQGVFDAVVPFKTEKEADDYVEKLKLDFPAEENMEVVKGHIELL